MGVDEGFESARFAFGRLEARLLCDDSGLAPVATPKFCKFQFVALAQDAEKRAPGVVESLSAALDSLFGDDALLIRSAVGFEHPAGAALHLRQARVLPGGVPAHQGVFGFFRRLERRQRPGALTHQVPGGAKALFQLLVDEYGENVSSLHFIVDAVHQPGHRAHPRGGRIHERPPAPDQYTGGGDVARYLALERPEECCGDYRDQGEQREPPLGRGHREGAVEPLGCRETFERFFSEQIQSLHT